jgi:integrase
VRLGVLFKNPAQQVKPPKPDRRELGLGRDPRGLVFTRADGQPLDPDSLSKAFRRLVAVADVTPITLHGLRHTHISHLLMDGVHVKVVSERAGHANVNITLSVYACSVLFLSFPEIRQFPTTKQAAHPVESHCVV